MTDIVSSIDSCMNTNYGNYTHTFFGLCELARKSSTDGAIQPMPATITGTHKRVQVSLDDKKQLITYFRIGESSLGEEIDGNDWSFGLDSGNVNTTQLIMIVAHKVELGEKLIYSIAKSLPDILTVSGYELVSLAKESIQVDHDHEEIYLREFGAGNYERNRLTWNLYALTFNVEFIPNENCV